MVEQQKENHFLKERMQKYEYILKEINDSEEQQLEEEEKKRKQQQHAKQSIQQKLQNINQLQEQILDQYAGRRSSSNGRNRSINNNSNNNSSNYRGDDNSNINHDEQRDDTPAAVKYQRRDMNENDFNNYDDYYIHDDEKYHVDCFGNDNENENENGLLLPRAATKATRTTAIKQKKTDQDTFITTPNKTNTCGIPRGLFTQQQKLKPSFKSTMIEI